MVLGCWKLNLCLSMTEDITRLKCEYVQVSKLIPTVGFLYSHKLLTTHPEVVSDLYRQYNYIVWLTLGETENSHMHAGLFPSTLALPLNQGFFGQCYGSTVYDTMCVGSPASVYLHTWVTSVFLVTRSS